MSWKNKIGNLLSEKGCYRVEYLYKNCLEPALKEIHDYMNEFNGINAVLNSYTKKEMSQRQVIDNRKIYRLTVSYPMDMVVFGKSADPFNRQFMMDTYFDRDKLVIEILYRRYGGPFLFQNSPEKEVLKSLKEADESYEKPEDRFKKWAEDVSARDIYREELSMNEVLEKGVIENRVVELYTEHLKHVEFTNR